MAAGLRPGPPKAVVCPAEDIGIKSPLPARRGLCEGKFARIWQAPATPMLSRFDDAGAELPSFGDWAEFLTGESGNCRTPKKKAALLGWGRTQHRLVCLRIRIRGERIPFLMEKSSRER